MVFIVSLVVVIDLEKLFSGGAFRMLILNFNEVEEFKSGQTIDVRISFCKIIGCHQLRLTT